MKRSFAMVMALALAASVPTPWAQAIPALSFKDARGITVSLPAKARRVVSLSPAITEILYAAGAGPAVVGVTTYCNFPAKAQAVAKIGGFSPNTVSVEAIVALKPDLVVGELSAHGQLAAGFERSGVRFAALPQTDFESVFQAIELLGRVAGDEPKSKALVASLRARMEAIRVKTASIPSGKRPVVFWETWDEPLMSVGPKSFTGQIIEAAGGRNCFHDSQADWPVVSFEAVLARDPDFIMAADSHGAALTPERLARRPGWSALKAVRSGHVVLLDGDIVSRPGPRLVDALERIAAVLYPELFN
jgi:iron complex transport system substrate-binding protein